MNFILQVTCVSEFGTITITITARILVIGELIMEFEEKLNQRRRVENRKIDIL